MMSGLFLAIDSDYEDLSKAASNYREQNVYGRLRDKGYLAKAILNGSQCQREAVASLATDRSVVYITGTGHGTDTQFAGYQKLDVYSVGNYEPDEVRDKIVHLVSCNCATGLGVDFVKNGCRAFFGYDAGFVFDLAASGIFFECDGQIDIALAAGQTVAQADAAARALFQKRADEATDPRIAAYLKFNLAHLCSPVVDAKWGQADATLNGS